MRSAIHLQADLRLRVRTFAEGVLLLSPASHWAVLINTNGWYGYEELKSDWYMRYLFTSQTLSAVYVRFERSPNLCSQPNFQVPLFIASKDPMYWLDLERSQKVDLGSCRSQGPNRSRSLEVKVPLTHPNRGVNEYLLMGN